MMNSQSVPTAFPLARSPLDRAVSILRKRTTALLAHVRESLRRRDVPGLDDIAHLDSRMRRDIGVEAAFLPRGDERRDIQFHRL